MPRGLDPQDRQFVESIILRGVENDTAYVLAFCSQMESPPENLTDLVQAKLHKKAIRNYMLECQNKIAESMLARGKWSKQVAETHLIQLLQACEDEIYSEQGLTKTNTSAAIQTIKELNALNGLNTKSLEVNGAVSVIIQGEDKLLE